MTDKTATITAERYRAIAKAMFPDHTAVRMAALMDVHRTNPHYWHDHGLKGRAAAKLLSMATARAADLRIRADHLDQLTG